MPMPLWSASALAQTAVGSWAIALMSIKVMGETINLLEDKKLGWLMHAIIMSHSKVATKMFSMMRC
eukprot:1097584-Amphidinium_carterae.1